MRFTLTHIIFTGQITGSSFHVSPWNNHYVDYENPDNSELQLELNSAYSGIIQIDWQLGNDGTISELVLG